MRVLRWKITEHLCPRTKKSYAKNSNFESSKIVVLYYYFTIRQQLSYNQKNHKEIPMQKAEKIKQATQKLEEIVKELGYDNLVKAIILCDIKGGFVEQNPSEEDVQKLDNAYSKFLDSEVSLIDEYIWDVFNEEQEEGDE